ncbi:MAG: flagellar basal-body rod protein FlgF [Spirochaetales bacterium]|jgi:flagellar basal-body rod protein FlgF|nr:flagellar basal-body rod protein FlgF [Spirochaetales bacterium]
MTNGIEILANAAIRQISRLDCVTHNIANVNTPGFKAERFHFLKPSSEAEVNEGRPAQGPATSVNYSRGIIQKTGNVLDLAIDGKGFFAIQTKAGVVYTKDGRFTLNKNGELVTLAGDYVLGRGGNITIKGNDIQISKEGGISVDGDEIDALRIESFREPSALIKINTGLYRNPDNLAGAKTEENVYVQSGYLELSNVQAIREMVEMINIQRTFESYQKAIQTISEQDRSSTTRVGRL